MEFVFLTLEWILNSEASQHILQHVKTEVGNCAFFVILVLLLLNVGGCGGQALRSKSILKLKTQIQIPKGHAQITFLNTIYCFLSQITIYNFPI